MCNIKIFITAFCILPFLVACQPSESDESALDEVMQAIEKKNYNKAEIKLKLSIVDMTIAKRDTIKIPYANGGSINSAKSR